MLEINGTIIAVIANFIILMWILERFFYKPVREALAERKKSIEDNISAAEKRNSEAGALKARYEDDISRAKDRAQEIIKQASDEADRIRSQAEMSAKAVEQDILAQARTDADNLKKEALGSAKADISDIVITAAGKLLGKKIDAVSDRALVDSFTDRVGRPELN